MNTVTLSGVIITYEYDEYFGGNFNNIILKGEDGYIVNLIGRLQELKASYPDDEIQVNYWLSDNYCTRDEIIEGFLNKIFGGLTVECVDNGFMGSSWTGYCEDFNTVLTIGGHDFFRELSEEDGKFIIIDFNIKKV